MELLQIKGIGPKKVSSLEKAGIHSILDLICYYPYRYQQYVIEPLSASQEKKSICVIATVMNEAKVFYFRRNFNRMTFQVMIENKIVSVVIFNRVFLKQHLQVGRKIVLFGSYDVQKNTFTASNIKFELFTSDMIEPIYHAISGVTNKEIHQMITTALTMPYEVDDFIPLPYQQQYDFMDKRNALQILHNPQEMDMLKKARHRMIYEELFMYMFKVNYLTYQHKKNNIGIAKKFDEQKLDALIKSLPFSLTEDQALAVEAIKNDLFAPKRMNRIVLGDVGSGKTIVAMLGLYMNFLAEYQGAFMAPTELLAYQHYETISHLFANAGMRVALLLGSMKKSEKEEVAAMLEAGSVDVVIGTHALLSQNVVFSNLGLVITDEQHRFGVHQRGVLQNKGIQPDVLYLSATPIPRTYAQMLYQDMDTSYIKMKPAGRKDILTYVKKEFEITDVLYKMLEELKAGHQIYVVAPLIEGDEESGLHDVNELKEKLDTAFAHKVPIGILHGKMKKAEKDVVMEEFESGKLPILISTTVIEVGIDVKNATMMVIFHAERFGLATLHQLRGRVGRNDVQSYCYLISDMEKERLRVMEESNDGFYISEMDFKLRGSGDLFGLEQSGDMKFILSDMKRDYKIMEQAGKDSKAFLEENIAQQFSLYPQYKRYMKTLDFID